jgi:ABC-type multidrug transport system ATPase subunit
MGDIQLKTVNRGQVAPSEPDVPPTTPSRNCVYDFFNQVIILLKKNFLVQFRSTTAFATQLFIGVIFLGILRLMQYSVESNPFFASDFFEVKSPIARSIELPDRCYSHHWENGCFSFIASPNDTSTTLGQYAANISSQMALDAGFAQRGEKYGYELFDDGAYIDDWLYLNQNATPIAIIFHHHGHDDIPKISYSLQVNTTQVCNTIGVLDCTDPKFDLMARFQRLVDQSILRVESGVPTATLDAAFSDFPHPAGNLDWDVMRDYGNDWLYVVIVFNFVIQLTFIVMEKEKGLRASMTQMGLKRSAYWISWFLSCEVINLFVVLLLCGFGNAIQMEFFLDNGFDVYFTMFFLSTTAFTLLAFFFSTLISSTEAARSFGIVWYVMTFIACPVLVFLYFYSGNEKDEGIIRGLSLIATAPFFKGIGDMIWASSGGRGKGMLWKRNGETTSTRADIETAVSGWSGDTDAWYSVDDAMLSLLWCCLLYAGLTWYFDHVVPNSFGLAQHPLFFLDPVYWGFERKKNKDDDNEISSTTDVAIDEEGEEEEERDDDVKAEEIAVRTGKTNDNTAIVINNLQKTFVSRMYDWVPSNSWGGGFIYASLPAALLALISQSPLFFIIFLIIFGLIFKFSPVSFKLRIMPTNQISKFSAVKGVSYCIENNSLFVLLGHNGAGKSTSFNMLTGLMPLSGGDAKILGYSVKHEMAQISKIMGVCPQHDVLWANLTGREHLELFARLKAIPADSIKAEVEARLVDVALEDAADIESCQYSGGMQRRLSLAIALLGDPKIVFLDEPTTGMDPVTRRKVWDTINRIKRGRVVILTTHSMEEAEILGDRVAIMSGGKLSCIGTSLHLKNKYGGGFRLSLACSDPEKVESVMKMVCDENLGVNASFISKTQDILLFKLGTNDASVLSPFFEKIENAKNEYKISDISIGNATLNDVFINLSVAEAKSDDLEEKQQNKKTRDTYNNDSGGDGEDSDKIEKQASCGASCFKCCFAESKYCCDCGCCSKDEPDVIPGEKEKTSKGLSSTPKGQVYAVVQKSLAFQLRQKKLMCCIIMFPTFFIVLIGLLGSLVFDPMTQRALDKYDWACLKDLLRETSYLPPAISVGNISPKNEQYKNDDWPPLPYLETPSFEFFFYIK